MKLCIKLNKTLHLFSIVMMAFLICAPLTTIGQGKRNHPKARAHHKNKAAESRLAHHHYRHLPKRGAVITKLPSGIIIISHKGKRIHYHNGVFYKAKGAASFSVVSAPIGLRLKVLPTGHKEIVYGKRHYFYHYGTFYKHSKAKDDYEVIEAPLGADVDAIPDGYKMEEIDGVTYYTLEDVKYMEKTNGTETLYEVVE